MAEVLAKGVGMGVTEARVEYVCESGETARDEIEVEVPSVEVTVIAWVDPAPLAPVLEALAEQANPALTTALNTPGGCTSLLTSWSLFGNPQLLFSDADRRYANAFLLANSPNAEPPPTIDPGAIQAGGDFRLFNHLQVFVRDEGASPEVEILQSAADVGRTPDPCGAMGTLLGAPDDHPDNDANGLTVSQTGAFQLNEGRLGFLGQVVDLVLNDCQRLVPVGPCLNLTQVGETTPWIWSVIRFGLDGMLGQPIDRQIFPTYYVYEQGELVSQHLQSGAEVFIALDENSQRLANEVP